MKVLASAAILAVVLAASAQAQPRLILQITVDQLRGHLPARYSERLGDGGLRYLSEQGVHFVDAHHAHGNTETIVGHSTLATGAYPSAHGMVGNLWFDRVASRVTYNIEDPEFPLIDENAGIDDATEIDPTQRAANTDGRSPRALLTATFSGELNATTAGRAKVFGVSVKDRGAVSMAGRTGKAFWFSRSSGRFVSSSCHYAAYPGWVDEWDSSGLVASYADKDWELMHPAESYLFGDRDDQSWEVDLRRFGRIFPIGSETGYVSPEDWDKEPAVARIKARFGITGKLVDDYNHPYLTLSQEILNNPDIGLAEIEEAVAAELLSFEDVAYAVPGTALIANQLPDTSIMRAIRNNYHPSRSGNIYVVFRPGRFIDDLDGLSVSVIRGSPWSYDTHVPVIFGGYGLKPRRVTRRVQTIDVAATLSQIAGTARPSGATGQVLEEAIR